MAGRSHRYGELPGGEILARPEKAKRLHKSQSAREERPHFWSRRRDLSVPGRKPVRLSYAGKDKSKAKISESERTHLRKTMSRAIRRTQKDVDELGKALEAAGRTGKIRLSPDMAHDVGNWFGINVKQININHIGQMHDKMSQIVGALKHPNFEIKIKENSEGNTIKRNLLTKPSQKISIELTRENAFNPKNDIRALIMAAGIAGANLFDDREALQYGVPGTFSQAAYKASSYASFSYSRQSAYERNWQIQSERARRKEQDLFLEEALKDYYVEAPRLGPDELAARQDEIVAAGWDFHSGRSEIREVTPSVAAGLQKGITALGNSVATLSREEYEQTAKDWLAEARDIGPNSAEPAVNRVGAQTQVPRMAIRRKPAPAQVVAENYRRDNGNDMLKHVENLKTNVGNFTTEDIQIFSAALKQEIDQALGRDHLSGNTYASVQKDLNELENGNSPLGLAAPTTKALPGNSFGLSPENTVGHDLVAMGDVRVEGITREGTLVDSADGSEAIAHNGANLENRNRAPHQPVAR